MDWGKIKKEYKEAFHKFHEYFWDFPYEKGKYPPIVDKELARFNVRDLYDFFDKQNIYICVLRFYNHKRWSWGTNMFEHPLAGYKEFNSRIEAEEEAFTKAFDLLEKQLNG